MYYDYTQKALRTDFYPICPFRQLQDLINPNENYCTYDDLFNLTLYSTLLCSVLWRNGKILLIITK
jgi:hypothetical protein